jgi:type I restriction enzyme S subunit
LGFISEKAELLLQSIFKTEFLKAGVVFEPLEKLVDILDSQRVPVNATERLKRSGEIPYYGATGQVGTIDKKIFNETLILLGEDGVPFFDPSKHKAYEISGPAWVNNHAHVLRAKTDSLIQRYLLHFLNVFDYTGFVNGATRLKLTQGDMKRIPVPLPSIQVQQEIVEKLDDALAAVESLRNLTVIKQEFVSSLRQSVVRTAFTSLQEVA